MLERFATDLGLASSAGLGAALAAIVVMSATPPRSKREWVIGLISTVVGSIAGGAYVIETYNLGAWATSTTGLMSILGVVFACGLPAWAVVRWVFTFIERRKDKGIDEVADDIREVIKGQ